MNAYFAHPLGNGWAAVNREGGVAMLLVEQNARAALKLAHRGYVMEVGRIVLQDSAQALLADPKERAEHLMLVDLARNDLLKVCQSDSVAVTEFMQVHKYSHIMHLVSTVEGDLRDDQNAIDAFRATFPAGTLSGAPKPRALEIIDSLEVANRGIYGGVVGYFDFAGNADLAITIRTAFIRDGLASVQAGAGIVLDSDPSAEHQETIAKASASLRAIHAANNLKVIR